MRPPGRGFPRRGGRPWRRAFLGVCPVHPNPIALYQARIAAVLRPGDSPASRNRIPKDDLMSGSEFFAQHFGLTERPFTLLPDPDFLYWSPAHKRAFSVLEYGVMTRAPITVITGEVGAGKTTLLQKLLTVFDLHHRRPDLQRHRQSRRAAAMGAERARRALRHGRGLCHQVPGAAGLGHRAVQPEPPRGPDHRRGAEPVGRRARRAPDAHQHQFQQGRALAADPDGPARTARDDHPPRAAAVRAAGDGELPHSRHGPRDHAGYIRHGCAMPAARARSSPTAPSPASTANRRRPAAGQQACGFRHGLCRHLRQDVIDADIVDEVLADDIFLDMADPDRGKPPNEIRNQVLLAHDPAPSADDDGDHHPVHAIGLVQACACPPSSRPRRGSWWNRRRSPTTWWMSPSPPPPTRRSPSSSERLLTRANLLEIANEFDVFENYSELPPDLIVERMQQATRSPAGGGATRRRSSP
jgi:hypothetical protein